MIMMVHDQNDCAPTGLLARLRAAKTEPWKAALPPTMLELLGRFPDHDAAVQWLRSLIGGDDVPVLDTGDDAEPVKRTRQRKPSLATAIRQMTRAGLSIAGCEINPRDGTFKLIIGKPVQMNADDRNEWDTVQ
jgi:hypothetical protein